MGIESRNYFRDGSYTNAIAGWGITFTPVVKYLILANVLVFLVQVLVTRESGKVADWEASFEQAQAELDKQEAAIEKDASSDADREQKKEALRKARRQYERLMSQMPGQRVSVAQEWLQLDPEKTVFQGQVWRLLTCAFCHDRHAIWHIVFNMLLLYWFGTRLENMYGSREFLLFYLAAALSASLAYVALAFYLGSNTPAIGASGAVMGVVMLYTIFYPWETIYVFWLIPVPICVLLALYVIYDLHPILLALGGERMYTGVAHAAHLGGLAFGYLYWRLGLRLEVPFDAGKRKWRWRTRYRPASKEWPAGEEPPILSHPARETAEEQAVDELLEKISKEGIGSLTDAERARLIQASAKYRKEK